MSFDYSLNKSLIDKLYQHADHALLGAASHLVSEPVNRLGQSALSVAIALRIEPLVRQILDCLVSEDMNDLMGCIDEGSWTALDHAAICPESNYYARLKELMGNRSYKQQMAPSTSFLRKAAELSRTRLSQSQFKFNFIDAKNHLHRLTCKAAVEQIPFSVKPERLDYFTYGTPEVLFEIWNHMAVMASRGKPYLVNDAEELSQYFDFVDQVVENGIIPEIAFKMITHNDDGNPVDVGMGIVALEAIPANKILMEYGGRYIIEDESHNHSYYRHEIMHGSYCIEGEQVRTPGATLNHGFPNVKIVKIVLPGRVILALKTLVPIRADQEICLTYGPDNFAYSDTPVKLTPKSVREFLRRYPPDVLHQTLTCTTPLIEDEYIVQGWTYFLRDSGVSFLKQCLKGRISPIQMLLLLEILKGIGEVVSLKHPLEQRKWENISKSFFRQVPLAVFIQALEICWYQPEKSPAKCRQLRGHLIPFNFRFS